MIDVISGLEDNSEPASTETPEWSEVVLVTTGVFWLSYHRWLLIVDLEIETV